MPTELETLRTRVKELEATLECSHWRHSNHECKECRDVIASIKHAPAAPAPAEAKEEWWQWNDCPENIWRVKGGVAVLFHSERGMLGTVTNDIFAICEPDFHRLNPSDVAIFKSKWAAAAPPKKKTWLLAVESETEPKGGNMFFGNGGVFPVKLIEQP